MVHLCGADAWRPAFLVDVEGGGHGQLVVSATDDTWRVIFCWASRGQMLTRRASRYLSSTCSRFAPVSPGESTLETAQYRSPQSPTVSSS